LSPDVTLLFLIFEKTIAKHYILRRLMWKLMGLLS